MGSDFSCPCTVKDKETKAIEQKPFPKPEDVQKQKKAATEATEADASKSATQADATTEADELKEGDDKPKKKPSVAGKIKEKLAEAKDVAKDAVVSSKDLAKDAVVNSKDAVVNASSNVMKKATLATTFASRVEQNTDFPSIEEVKLGFALATAAYLGEDIAPEEHYVPALFDPSTGESVPKETQEKGLGPCLSAVFGLTIDHFMNIKESDTQGFIAHNDDTVVLCFRGSMQAMDWVTNVEATITPWKPFEHGASAGHTGFLTTLCKKAPGVHAGHYNAFLSTKKVLEEHLIPQLKAVTTSKKLIICGHSLGGSLATQALAYLLEWFSGAEDKALAEKIEICFVTIGAPRIGNESFVLHVLELLMPWEEVDRIRIGRFVNKVDIVPYSSSGLIFRHLGRALLLTDTGETFLHDEKQDGSEDKFISSRVSAKETSERIKDHLTGAYRAVMYKCEDTIKKVKADSETNKAQRLEALKATAEEGERAAEDEDEKQED